MNKPELESKPDVWAEIARLRISRLDILAPRVQEAARAALDECHGKTVTVPVASDEVAVLRLDADVCETARTNELQQLYYRMGTSNAATAEKSWHFYRLALDVISKRCGWFTGAAAREAWPDPAVRAKVSHAWFRAVADVFKAHGFDWGGDWHRPDEPHMQWGTLAASPHDAPRIFAAGGFEAVWRAVGAM